MGELLYIYPFGDNVSTSFIAIDEDAGVGRQYINLSLNLILLIWSALITWVTELVILGKTPMHYHDNDDENND